MAIGVILSGMGSDGMFGLRAIKEKSGLTLVQDPASASADSMPRSAIGAGVADIVARPEELPSRIIAYLGHPATIPLNEPALETKIQSDLDKIVVLLRDRSGNDFTLYKTNTLIRRIEAMSAAGFCGVKKGNCHFLDMPFYQTGMVKKLPITDEDVDVVLRPLMRLRPDIVFAAGDLSDPHGTHRMCLQAVFHALEQYKKKIGSLPEVWLYRGAWQEWEPHQIDMAVPVSPDELYHKRHAIFRHESQKDRAMFPGPYDAREFWQRAEDRNRSTAAIYDKLGLPQYHAIEAFVQWKEGSTL